MRLLICVQTVDLKDDPLMGFFHGWLVELAKHFESIHVICLREGEHHLPEHVHIHSLGKESGKSRLEYILRFYKHLFCIRGTYDRVFVHMNPHYVLMGGLYWKMQGTPIFFWRNHAKMNLMTRIAAGFSKNVFYTSSYACMSVFKHALQMPVGIDTHVFMSSTIKKETRLPKKILFLGRLSPVKRVELFIEAGTLLGEAYELHVYGDDPSKEKKYGESLMAKAGPNVFFHPAVQNNDTPMVYHAHDLYVNLTPEGSMDKTVLEAIACGIPTLVANASFADVVPAQFCLDPVTKEQLAKKIVECTSMKKGEEDMMIAHSQSIVVREHSLEKLATMLNNVMQ
jgi:glycosyltransferase involved in cell wall biosynthesis